MTQDTNETKTTFLLKNLLRGLLWFVLLMVLFIAVQDRLKFHFQSYAETVQQTPIILFVIFGVSELMLGLVPPEFFMIISILKHISLLGYIQNILLYTLISYTAGVAAYFVGYRFSTSRWYQNASVGYLKPYHEKLRKYGSYLVFVGAVTPVPFSATCILAGSVKMSFSQFLIISSFRVVRFAVYGWLVWKFPIWFGA